MPEEDMEDVDCDNGRYKDEHHEYHNTLAVLEIFHHLSFELLGLLEVRLTE